MRIVTICVVLSLAAFLHAQTTQSTPLDLKDVVTDANTPDWKPRDATPPLIVVGSSGFGPQQDRCRYEYAWAANGRFTPGTRHVLGFLGAPFPAGSSLQPVSFSRTANEFHLAFEFKPNADPSIAQKSAYAFFFAAPLPIDLPDGNYEFHVEIKGLDLSIKIPATLNVSFQKPDPEIKRRKDDFDSISTLPDAELIKAFIAQAAEVKGVAGPREARSLGNSPMDFTGHDYQRYVAIKEQIVRRQNKIVPALLELLKSECNRNPDPADENPANARKWREFNAPLGLTAELMKMIVEIDDARLAPLLIEILAGERKANRFVRAGAIDALEELTTVRFRKYGPHHGQYAKAVFVAEGGDKVEFKPLPFEAMKEKHKSLAALHRHWIAGFQPNESDTSPWLKAAQSLAHDWLDGNNLDEAYNAAAFLTYTPPRKKPRNDDPARTHAQLFKILSNCKLASADKSDNGFVYHAYTHQPTGNPLPVTPFNWAEFLTRTAPLDDRDAALLIRFDQEMKEIPGSMLRYLNAISGKEAMAYRIKMDRELPEFLKSKKIDPSAGVGETRDPLGRMLVWNRHLAREGIERWAGRSFASGEEIAEWWKENESKSQEDWLRAGLKISAERADAGEARSQFLFRLLLGDALPNKPSHPVWLPAGTSSEPPPRAESTPPFRVKWLAENESKLVYSPQSGGFSLSGK